MENLDLKLNQKSETNEEWILAHIENDSRDGKYIGRAEVFNYHKAYFQSLNSRDKVDAEIMRMIGMVKQVKYDSCNCRIHIAKSENESYYFCEKKKKKIGALEPRKICEDHSKFVNCKEILV
jgi:hypothetical protein